MGNTMIGLTRIFDVAVLVVGAFNIVLVAMIILAISVASVGGRGSLILFSWLQCGSAGGNKCRPKRLNCATSSLSWR